MGVCETVFHLTKVFFLSAFYCLPVLHSLIKIMFYDHWTWFYFVKCIKTQGNSNYSFSNTYSVLQYWNFDWASGKQSIKQQKKWIEGQIFDRLLHTLLS